MNHRNGFQEALSEVTTLRDVARVQAHLFSIDARDRWREVERALDSARIEVQKDGEEAAEIVSLADVARHLAAAKDAAACKSFVQTFALISSAKY